MVHRIKVPTEILVSSSAGDVFESAKWKLTHSHKGKLPAKVIDETVDEWVKKGFVEKKFKDQVSIKAKSYMVEFMKKWGEPPR